MQGVVRGAFWGLIVMAAGLAALSVLIPIPVRHPGRTIAVTAEQPVSPSGSATPRLTQAAPPEKAPADPQDTTSNATAPAPRASGVELPAGSEFSRPRPEGAARLPGTEDTAMPAPAPKVPQPSAEQIVTAPAPDTATASAPRPDTETPATMTPPNGTRDTVLPVPGQEQPVLPAPESAVPVAPPVETRPDMPTTPSGTQQPHQRSEAPAPAKTLPPVIRPEPPRASGPVPDDQPPGALRVPVPGKEIAQPDVKTGRLPTIGRDPAATAQADSPATDTAALRALSRYAAPFDAEPGKPLLSVILIDEGAKGLDRATLTTFSFPVTFAIDASRPDAAQAMRAYRDAGFEVVLLARGLPEGATPQDLEVMMATYQARVPEAVAVMDAETGGFQTNRPLLRQLAAIVNQTGQGIITYDRGLNTAAQVAASEQVPDALIFRVLDGEDESATTIRRYLDRAAFKAGQDGHVVMVGHSRPETVTALFSWALDSGQGDVTLAPISAILRGK